MICRGDEGEFRFQLFFLMYFLKTFLPVEQIEPMDWFLKETHNEFICRLIGPYSDFSL